MTSFSYPILPARRTAVLVPGFRSRGVVRVFHEGWNDRARKFAPEAVAATLPQLEELSRTKVPSLTHAVIVVARMSDPRLSEKDRERLWNQFRVPVFEQVVGEDGALLAAECEAHDGLHILSEVQVEGEIDITPCGCGRATPRLRRIGYAGIHDSRCDRATSGT